ncbi:MAG: dihydrolipoamide acetyltransferase family protein [Lawsonibacter sp.]
MAKVIIMPKLGFTQEEGLLVEWHKQVGEPVHKGEPFFDVHTDKSVVTVDATEDGTLLKIVAEPNSTLPVFTPIAVVGELGEDADAAIKAHVMDVASDEAVKADFDGEEPQQADEPEQPTPAMSARELKLTPKARRLVKDEGYDPAAIAWIQGTGFQGGITAKDIKASPLARKIAEKQGVDLSAVAGTGTKGKVMKQDVVQPTQKAVPEKKVAGTEPYDGVRKIIGQRLSESKFTAPHLYFTDAVDTTRLTEFRRMLNEKGEGKVAVSDLLIMAASKALRKFPGVNSSLVGDQIVTYESINVGMAVAGEHGLIVPVVKNVQEKTISQVAQETRDLVERAKAGRLVPAEYSGGTFSISNLGMFGIGNFTAIINPPEAAILSISSVRKTPVAVTNEAGEDEIAIRPMMNIQLSVDHRIVDGLLAARFVEYMKQLLEEPIKVLL